MTAQTTIPFIDLAEQQKRIRANLDSRMSSVLDHGAYIMGPEVKLLEQKLSEFCGARHSIGCSNGTDAIVLGLMALGVRPGDAVFCPSFTFCATAEAVVAAGGTPFFVDIELDTYNMCPASLGRAIAEARSRGLKPAGVIAVDLFGCPADYEAINTLADEAGLWVIADAAQSFGASRNGRKSGTIGRVTTTSFFPAKPLGCYGDGGAVFTDDDDVAEVIRSLIVHGKGTDKYDNVRIGMNGRLDTLQAAILLEKLTIFPDEIERRQEVAERYTKSLGDHFLVPAIPSHSRSVWAQYTLRLEHGERDRLLAWLKDHGVPAAIYYPKPLHLQTAYKAFPSDSHGLLNSEIASNSVFSIPMHPYLEKDIQDYIISTLISFPRN